jgi:predicted permease
VLYALWLHPPRSDLRSWLLVTALLLPSAAEIAIRAAEYKMAPRYAAASILLLLTWGLLFEQIWRAPSESSGDPEQPLAGTA